MKPELLLPAGNPESFYAAIKGGADAVYLGLKDFNARNRAKNFSYNQFFALRNEAQKNNVKVYLTLNTLVKNSELKDLLNNLQIIEKLNPDAVIIQDLGILYLLINFFPKLKFHASTQMAIQNSIGANFADKKGFERVILFREVTKSELEKISKKSKIDLEIFVHGALCYSFSGICLFSSYLGGMSANRGQCRQPCRRKYKSGGEDSYIFNLKDFQLIEHIPQLTKLGISSLKIEGRMKSAEYVYQVARAYRMAIDSPDQIESAKKILEKDLGRQKNSYFYGGNVAAAISNLPYTGIEIGTVEKLFVDGFAFSSNMAIHQKDRIRILDDKGKDSAAIKLNKLHKMESASLIEVSRTEKNDTIFVKTDKSVTIGAKIFLAGLGELNFKNKLPVEKTHFKTKNMNKLLSFRRQTMNKPQIFVRIDSRKWMRKIHFESLSYLILKLDKAELQRFHLNRPFLKKNQHKIIMELPKFIPEADIHIYKQELHRLHREGLSNFMIAHISQKLILPKKKVNIFANESIYVLNDFAAQFLKDEGIETFVYPFESDFENLGNFAERRGIVPIYYNPELFYSRMPVSSQDNLADNQYRYRHFRKEGTTRIVPDRPVAITQFKEQLFKMKYRRFLIDLSYEKPSENLLNRILKTWSQGKAIQPSSHFNFKLGLH